MEKKYACLKLTELDSHWGQAVGGKSINLENCHLGFGYLNKIEF